MREASSRDGSVCDGSGAPPSRSARYAGPVFVPRGPGALPRAVLVALSLCLAACDGDSPTEVDDPGGPGGLAIVFDDPAGELAGLEATLRSVLESTFEGARSRIPIHGLTITVASDPPRTIPGWGIGGFTLGASLIEITVDPAFAGSGQIVLERTALAAAHEMHHAARIRGPGYGSTLFEAIVSEGLADHFSLELLGGPIPPWIDAFPVEETQRYWRLAGPELEAPFDYPRWFFGQDPEIPRWTGYTLGFRLVGSYLDSHSTTAAELVHAPASLFRDGIGASG